MANDEFKVLTDKEHALLNADMYVGSLSMEEHDVLVNGTFKKLHYVPGLIKITDEIIDNCVDEAIRTDFEHANQIEVTIADNYVTVSDNGRGLPQGMIQTPEGETIPRPLAAWTRARAGSNFNADRKTIGKNGVGSALTNFFSDYFVGETCDGKNKITVHCTNNADNVSYTSAPCKKKGTTVKFMPDFTRFGIFQLDDTFEDVIYSRLVSLAVAFPAIKFKYNGKVIDSKFKSFIQQFGTTVHDITDHCSVFFAASDEYRELSFVNGVHTKQGGNHSYGVMDLFSDELIAMVKRKHKVEINKARIKESIFMGLFIRDLVSPKYDGQTKERLSSPWAQIRDHIDLDYKSLARKVLNTPDLIDPIIANALARKEAADKAAATKAQKKARSASVPKHVKASGLGKVPCTLFVAEGDSAIGPFIKVRDDKTMGGFPLRGKVLNTWNMPDVDVLKNKEISQMVSIFGVGLGEKTNPAYDKIAIMTDADADGKGSIFPLMLGFIYKYWPHWYDEGRVHFVRTPEYISTSGKKTVWCYSDEEFRSKDWTGKWEHRHIKGLGSLTEEEYRQCIQDPVLERVGLDPNAKELFDILLDDKHPEKRKKWLGFDGDMMEDDE